MPLNLAISTFLSAATIIQVACSISSFVKAFFIPAEPFVSTFILIPLASAFWLKFSAAINVCAIPVGQAVTARTVGKSDLVSVSSSTSSSGNFSFISLKTVSPPTPESNIPIGLLSIKSFLSFSSIKSRNSSTDGEFIKSFLKLSSINIVDNLDSTSKWVSLAPSGAAIIKNKWDKLSSKAS